MGTSVQDKSSRRPQEQCVDKLRTTVQPATRWLDIGCRKVVPDWVLSTEEQEAAFGSATLIGIDVDAVITEHPLLEAKAFTLAGDLPFGNASSHFVSANKVMEHERDPGHVLNEVHRVLRPGGRFVFHPRNCLYYPILIASIIPQVIKKRIIWSVEGCHESDVFPTLYRINPGSAIRKLAQDAGFVVSELRHVAPNRVLSYRVPLERTIESRINRLTHSWAERLRSNLAVVLSKVAGPETPSARKP